MTQYDISAVLEDEHTRLAGQYVAAFRDYLVAVVLKNAPQTRDARLRLEDVVREAMGKAEVLGALSTLREASGVVASDTAFMAERSRLVAFADSSVTKILSRVTFAEALEDLVDRVPATFRNAAERTAGNIADTYSSGRGVISFAKSAEDAVTHRAQELITKGVREGIPEKEIGKTMSFDVNRIRTETEAWTEGYARMAFRTNLNSAVAEGRLRQARDPDVKKVVPALRFTAVGDGDTRPNHEAADGVILSADNSAWRFMSPPFGYNCRCQLDLVSAPELRRMGRVDSAGKVIESRIPSGARPDAGFRSGGPS